MDKVFLLLLILFGKFLAFGLAPIQGWTQVPWAVPICRRRSRPTRLGAAASQRHVVVVGGGVGGLAVAARIASNSSKNTRVTILEKNDQVGGRCGSFYTRSDPGGGLFRHERGPSLLLLPDVYQRLFSDCGTTAQAMGLDMQQCVPAYQVVFDDGDRIQLGFPKAALSNEPLSSPQKSSQTRNTVTIQELEQASRAAMNRLAQFYRGARGLRSLPAFVVEALRDGGLAWPLQPHSDFLDKLFSSDKMKALASFQDLYVGLEPYRNKDLGFGGVLQSTAPAVFGLLAAIELHPTNPKSGVFAPVGGFHAVSNAMERLAREQGVHISTNQIVTHVATAGIHVRSTKNATSSSASTRFIPADLVIVNADLPYATKSLVRDHAAVETHESVFDWDDRFAFSSGVIAFHWSVDQVLDQLETHNVFLMASSRSLAESSWDILRTKHGDVTPESAFNFYVHRPSRTDPTAAPPGCDTLMVLLPCRTLLRDEICSTLPRHEALERYQAQFSPDVIAQARTAVLARLAVLHSLKNLKDHILDEVTGTPATWADQFQLGAGTPFALLG